MFDEIVIPDGWRSPPENAPVVLRTVAPPGGGHSNTIWTVVWQETDGSWWFWKQDRHSSAASPPEPPPEGTPEHAAHMARWYGRPLADVDRWPPEAGPLGARDAAALEAALNDPCRATAGPYWPSQPPPPPPPPIPGVIYSVPPPPAYVPDAAPTYVELRESGREPIYLGGWTAGAVADNALIAAAISPNVD